MNTLFKQWCVLPVSQVYVWIYLIKPSAALSKKAALDDEDPVDFSGSWLTQNFWICKVGANKFATSVAVAGRTSASLAETG